MSGAHDQRDLFTLGWQAEGCPDARLLLMAVIYRRLRGYPSDFHVESSTIFEVLVAAAPPLGLQAGSRGSRDA